MARAFRSPRQDLERGAFTQRRRDGARRSGVFTLTIALAAAVLVAPGTSMAKRPGSALKTLPLQFFLTYMDYSPGVCANFAEMALNKLGVRLTSQQPENRMGVASNVSAAVVCVPESNGVGILTAATSTSPDTASSYVEQIYTRMNATGTPASGSQTLPTKPLLGAPLSLQLGVFHVVQAYAQVQSSAISSLKGLGLTVIPTADGIVGYNAEVTAVIGIVQAKTASGPFASVLGTEDVIILAASINNATAESYRNRIRSAMTAVAPIKIR